MKRLLSIVAVLLILARAASAQVCPSNVTAVSPADVSCWVPPNSGVTISDLTDTNPVTIASDSIYALYSGNTIGCGTASSQQPQNIAAGCDLTSAVSYSPSAVTLVMSFSGTGGPLAQFASTSSVSAPFQYYELYLDAFGRLSWGVQNYGALNVLQTGSQDRPKVYADGNQHIAVVSIGANGMRIYVDGSLVANNSLTLSNYATGYWLFGQAGLSGNQPSGNAWPYAPAQTWFNGTLYYWAWWNSQLTDAQAEALSNPGTNPPSNISNNYVNLTGQIASLFISQGLAYANAGVTFHTESAQLPACGATIPVAPSSQTYYTDSQGNLPPNVNLQQGLHLTMTVGQDSLPLVMPCQSSIALSALIPAQTPLPDAVSAVVLAGPLFQGTTVSNPAVGTVGPATLTSPGSIANACAGGTVTINRALSSQQSCTMTAATTIAFSNMLDGAPALTLDIITDGNGAHVPTFPGGVVWPGLTPPTISTGAGMHTFYAFVDEGGTIYGSIASSTAGQGAFPLTATANANHYSINTLNSLGMVSLSAPVCSCVATCSGTCATTYTYDCASLGDNSTTSSVSTLTTCTNAASLSASKFNMLSWAVPTGAYGGVDVFGRISGSLGLLAACTGTSGNCTATSYKDDGSATPGAVPPIIGNAGTIISAGFLGVPSQWMQATGGGANGIATGNFLPVMGLADSSATEALTEQEIPALTEVIGLHCFLTSAPGATAKAFIFTLDVGGTPTARTCTITDPAVTCDDTAAANNVAIPIKSLVDTAITSSGSPSAKVGGCSYEVLN